MVLPSHSPPHRSGRSKTQRSKAGFPSTSLSESRNWRNHSHGANTSNPRSAAREAGREWRVRRKCADWKGRAWRSRRYHPSPLWLVLAARPAITITLTATVSMRSYAHCSSSGGSAWIVSADRTINGIASLTLQAACALSRLIWPIWSPSRTG